MNISFCSCSAYQNGILYFNFCGQTGKQEFRHCSVLRNKCREIRSARLIYLSCYIIQVPSSNLSLFADQFQNLFREDGNLALVKRVGFTEDDRFLSELSWETRNAVSSPIYIYTSSSETILRFSR